MEVQKYNLKKAAIAGVLFFFITGLVTGLIPNPFYIRKVPITLLDYVFLATTTVLSAAFFGKQECGELDRRLSYFGGATGFLAFACPTCNLFLLSFFSSSAILTYFDPLRPLLGIVSTTVLAILIWR